MQAAAANLYSLKTEKIPSGSVALGNWLGGYFTYCGVREPAGLAPEACGLAMGLGQLVTDIFVQ